MGEFLGNFEFLNDPVEHHHVSMYELYDSNVVINLLTYVASLVAIIERGMGFTFVTKSRQ